MKHISKLQRGLFMAKTERYDYLVGGQRGAWTVQQSHGGKVTRTVSGIHNLEEADGIVGDIIQEFSGPTCRDCRDKHRDYRSNYGHLELDDETGATVLVKHAS